MTTSDVENVAALRRILELEPTEPLHVSQETEFFVGSNQPKPDGRVFGGQVLAQCVVAGGMTVDEDRPIHSLHGYFLRSGDVAEPIVFGVEKLRDGGSFSARRVHAYQHGEPIMSVMASFQREQGGLDHHDTMPANVPAPEDCPETKELIADVDIPHARDWLSRRPFDVAPIQPDVYCTHKGERTSRQAVWIRTSAEFPADPLLNSAALAYASDFNLLEPAMRVHGLAWQMPGLRLASLDHAMWWHRPIRVDEWMLYVEQSPSTEGGRALGCGRIFARTGELLATVAQQGMMRVKIA